MAFRDRIAAGADLDTRIRVAQAIIDADREIQAAISNLRAVLTARGALVSSLIASPEQTAAFKRLDDAVRSAGVQIPDGYRIYPQSGQLGEKSKYSWTATALVLTAPFVVGAAINAIPTAATATTPAAGSVLPSSSIPAVSQVGHLATPAAITSQGASAAVYTAAAAPAVASVGPATVSSVGSVSSGATKALSSLRGLIGTLFAPTPPIVDPRTQQYAPPLAYGTSFDQTHWIMAGLALLAVVAIARN